MDCPGGGGPLDIGAVVTQVALTVDPETGWLKSMASTPNLSPTSSGIPLKVRDLRSTPIAPTSPSMRPAAKREMATATVFGSYLDVFNPADDVPVARSDRYEAASCASLLFKPKLQLSLKGSTSAPGIPA